MKQSESCCVCSYWVTVVASVEAGCGMSAAMPLTPLVSNLLPDDVSLRAHDVAQLVQVLRAEVPVVAVAALHVFVYAMQIQGHVFQQFRLQTRCLSENQMGQNSAERGFCLSVVFVGEVSAQINGKPIGVVLKVCKCSTLL